MSYDYSGALDDTSEQDVQGRYDSLLRKAKENATRVRKFCGLDNDTMGQLNALDAEIDPKTLNPKLPSVIDDLWPGLTFGTGAFSRSAGNHSRWRASSRACG